MKRNDGRLKAKSAMPANVKWEAAETDRERESVGYSFCTALLSYIIYVSGKLALLANGHNVHSSHHFVLSSTRRWRFLDFGIFGA